MGDNNKSSVQGCFENVIKDKADELGKLFKDHNVDVSSLNLEGIIKSIASDKKLLESLQKVQKNTAQDGLDCFSIATPNSPDIKSESSLSR